MPTTMPISVSMTTDKVSVNGTRLKSAAQILPPLPHLNSVFKRGISASKSTCKFPLCSPIPFPNQVEIFSIVLLLLALSVCSLFTCGAWKMSPFFCFCYMYLRLHVLTFALLGFCRSLPTRTPSPSKKATRLQCSCTNGPDGSSKQGPFPRRSCFLLQQL